MTDEQTGQATTLYPTDVADESKREKYSRLALANSLNWNGKWRDETRATKRDQNAILDAIAGQLQLTPYQHQRSRSVFDDLPDGFSGQGYSTRVVALCVCGIVGREDGRNYHPNKLHPNASSESGSGFSSIADEIDVSYQEVYSCWSTVKQLF